MKVVYSVCTHCGFTYKKPKYHVSPDDEKALYDQHQNTMENKGYVAMFNRFLSDAVHPFIEKGKALEFGSGPGPVLYELLRREGFDASHYDPFYHPDTTPLDETYDLITSTEVFEHLSKPLETTRRLSDLLKPGGYLAVMTTLRPQSDGTFLSWWYRRDKTHIAFYTHEAMQILASKNRLRLIHTNQKNHFTFKKESE